MEEIKVGEYVREKNTGKIYKIEYKSKADTYMAMELGSVGYRNAKYIDYIKHSKNIIDLIEVGDYVNGHIVEEIDFENESIFTANEYKCGVYDFDEIKSIVTKEKFESVKYEV